MNEWMNEWMNGVPRFCLWRLSYVQQSFTQEQFQEPLVDLFCDLMDIQLVR